MIYRGIEVPRTAREDVNIRKLIPKWLWCIVGVYTLSFVCIPTKYETRAIGAASLLIAATFSED